MGRSTLALGTPHPSALCCLQGGGGAPGAMKEAGALRRGTRSHAWGPQSTPEQWASPFWGHLLVSGHTPLLNLTTLSIN